MTPKPSISPPLTDGHLKNFQFSKCLMGFSLKAMPQEIQRIISLTPYQEKVMFYDKFYFLPSTKEKWTFQA